MKKGSRDLTQGRIVPQILIFALPILLGEIFQSLYNSVDSIVVGNYVGKTALAAVTSCSDIAQLLAGFFTGLSVGSGVVFAKFFGAGEHKKLHDAIHTAILFAAVLGLSMALIGIIITPALLNLVHCPEDVYQQAAVYMRIYLIGIFFTSIYNVAAGVLRAVGDSTNPFYYLLAASFTNIVLDIVFVRFLNMGVSGVAFATIIAQFLSVFLIFRNMLKTRDVYKLTVSHLHIDRKMLLEIIRFGLPSAAQSCMISFSNMFIQRYVNGFGSSAMAGIGAAKKIERYVGMMANSIGLTTTTFVAQNVGAGKYDRAFKSLRYVIAMAFTAVLIMGLPIYLNAEFFLRIFTKDPEAVSYGVDMVLTMLPLYFVQAYHNISCNAIRGFGHSTVVMLISVAGLIGCRQLILAIAMHFDYSIVHIYYSFPIGWGSAAIMSTIYYWFKIRRPYNLSLRKAAEVK